MREFSAISSNWRSEQVTDEYMERYAVPVLAEIDTRALVRHLRTHGVMRGRDFDGDFRTSMLWSKRPEKFARWMGPIWRGLFRRRPSYHFDADDSRNQSGDPCCPMLSSKNQEARKQLHVVAYDFGIKQNILRMLTREGCRVTVVPAETTADDVLATEAGWSVSLQWPGRSGAGGLCREGDSRHDGACAGVWHLPWTSTLRPGAGRQDLQAEVRAPRRQSSGARTTPRARWRSRRTTTTSPSIRTRSTQTKWS